MSGMSEALYDMGCYEFPYQEYTFIMPAGTGLASDYRLLTVPLSNMGNNTLLTYLESALGTYDSQKWRVFAYNSNPQSATYMEIIDVLFQDLFSQWQGKAFWAIGRSGSLNKTSIVFQGTLTGNRKPFDVFLKKGWNLISLPWPKSAANPDDIQLQYIVVEDNSGHFFQVTDLGNTITQKSVWDYTSSGYAALSQPTDALVAGKGYWIYVNSPNASMGIPPDNANTYFSLAKVMHSKKSSMITTKATEDLTPPPPPGQTLKAEGGNGCFIESLFSGI
jgi:hypothetical protein